MPDPESQTAEDAALFARLKGWFKDSQDRHADWYKEAEECFGFVAGRSVKGDGQWPGDSWQEMIDSGRQPIEFNRVGPIVDAVCGLEVNNRQEIKYIPRTAGDGEVNERLSSLGKWARDEAHAEDEESEMFRNATICGRGATETRISFDEEPTGKIMVDCLDPLECGVDPNARKACFSDRRYSWRFRDLPADEAKAMFPGADAIALDASWARMIDIKDGGKGNKIDYPDETRSALRDDKPPKVCRVVMIEWWEYSDHMLVAKPGMDEPEHMSTDAWDELEGEAEEQGWTATKAQQRRYRKAFLGRNSVLEVQDVAGFAIQWMTGRWDRNKGYHYAIVRPMRDPQMLSNKTLAQVLHILSTNANGGLLVEQGAFRNPRDAERDWSNPAKSIVLNEGGIAKIKERTAPAIPAALVQLQEFSLSSIRDVTGANVEMLGMADREQAASLEYQRRQSAMTILAGLFNGLRHYRKLQGRTLLNQLKLLPPGALVRVLIDPEVAMAEYRQSMMQWQQAAMQAVQQGQEPPPQPEPPGAEFMSTTKRGEQFDPAKFGLGEDARFDVIVDETPSSPNQKEAVWAALQPFMGQMAAIPAAMKVALKYSPLPETAVHELSEALDGEGGVPPELQQAIQDGQQRIAELEQENTRLRTASQIDAARVGVAQQDAETRRLKAEGDMQVKEAGMQLDYARLAHEIVKAQQQPRDTFGG